MTEFTAQDFKTLSTAVHALQSVKDLRDFFPAALAQMKALVHSDVTLLAGLANDYLYTYRLDNLDFVRKGEFGLAYWRHNLALQHSLRQGNVATCLSDFYSVRELERVDPLYERALKPLDLQDQLRIGFSPAVETRGLPQLQVAERRWQAKTGFRTAAHETFRFALHRSSRSFMERDRQILELFQPYLAATYDNAMRYTLLNQEITKTTQTLDAFGLIRLNLDGKIQAIGQRGQQLLRKYFPEESIQRRELPDALKTWVTQRLQHLVHTDRHASPNNAFVLDGNPHSLVVRLLLDLDQMECCLSLDEHLPCSLTPEIFQVLGLTQREAEIMLWMVQGKTNEEIAIVLNISRNTISKHLEHIYRKLGSSHRSEAILIALRRIGILNF